MPGIDGAAIAPITASVASVTLSCSDSNQRSRIGRAAPVRISMASVICGPRFWKERPSLNSFHRPPRPGRTRFGGIIGRVGSTTAATRWSICSYFG